MKDTPVTIEKLSKRYLVGHQAASRKQSTFRDVVVREAGSFLRKAVDVFHGNQIVQGDEVEEFWALRNVSFEVKQGEVVGIIGRNGAGKSTLLKVLSRITEPTEGRVTLRGRVSSLLEVGTGFHSELTGRENIFLNGAILGLTKQEIRKKFDEIVAFAEVERFLDTPVKHYSSGMYVRLAFAVAAHLEPEILIIDEVLAVGDASFQEKCLGKIRDVAAGGRTVLFVSHNMSAVLQLTNRAILLSHGTVDFVGDPAAAVERYSERAHEAGKTEFDVRNSKRHFQGTGDIVIQSLRFDRPFPSFGFLEPIGFTVRLRAQRDVKRMRISMTILAADGSPVGSSFSPETDGLAAEEERNVHVALCKAQLAPGSYFCGISVGRGNHRSTNVDYDVVTDVLFFEVQAEQTEGGSMASWSRGWGAISFPDLSINSARND